MDAYTLTRVEGLLEEVEEMVKKGDKHAARMAIREALREIRASKKYVKHG